MINVKTAEKCDLATISLLGIIIEAFAVCAAQPPRGNMQQGLFLFLTFAASSIILKTADFYSCRNHEFLLIHL